MVNISEIVFTYFKAFLVGGLICTIGQLILNYTKITSGKILVSFLLAGVLLQAVGVYEYIVDFGGAGATVPISGFGYLLAKGAMDGAKKGLFDALTGGITAGAMGIASAIVFGYLCSLIFKPRSKIN